MSGSDLCILGTCGRILGIIKEDKEDQEALPLSTFYYGVPLVVDMECYIYIKEEKRIEIERWSTSSLALYHAYSTSHGRLAMRTLGSSKSRRKRC